MNPADILYYDHYRNEYFAVSVEITGNWIRLTDLKNAARPFLFPLKDCTLRFKDDLYILYIDKNRYSYLQIPSSNPLHDLLPNIVGVSSKSNFARNKISWVIVGILAFAIGLYFLFAEFFPKVAIKFISVNSEIEMGDRLFRGMKENLKIDKNASMILQDFADQLHLSKQYPIKITVVESDVVNAYALPGGHIVVNSAILKDIEKPESLVALLSHETTHINRRHSLQNILSSMGSGFVITLFTNAGGSAANMIIGNADYLRVLRYSRQLEQQADAEGMVLMNNNHINPEGMMQLMQTLKVENDDQHPQGLSFLSTHPLTDERIKDAQRYVRAHPFDGTAMNEKLVDDWKQIKFLESKEN